jgi:beta-glucanase (GH16 family)
MRGSALGSPIGFRGAAIARIIAILLTLVCTVGPPACSALWIETPPIAVEKAESGANHGVSPASSGINDSTPAATPVFSPAAGSYTKPQKVTITDATPGAIIYYAFHGQTPTSASLRYKGPIAVSSPETIEAIAVAKGHAQSEVARAHYVIDLPPAATPTFSPPPGQYGVAQHVRILDATPGAVIYYTTNGQTPTSVSARYTNAIPVSSAVTIKAIALAANAIESAAAKGIYDVRLTAATPIIMPAGKSYSTMQTITIQDSTAGATIYYATNGETPTTASARYTKPFTLGFSSSLQMVTAIAVAPKDNQSAVASAIYTIKPLVATPTFNPPAGTYSSATPVSISDITKGTTIYYTTNGKIPTTASARYTAPVNVGKTETIQAIAVVGDNPPSLAGSAAYTVTPETTAPPFVSSEPALNGALVVSLASNTYGATVHYTVNGSIPTTGSQTFQAPFLVTSDVTVKAIATSPALADSPVTTESFAPDISSGTLVWSDEFNNTTKENLQPDPHIWTYDTGTDCCGNNELETYCYWNSTVSGCNPASPNGYVGTDGYLHIVARQPSPGVYTSARLKTQGLFSLQYGRIEVRAKLPEAQGLWPAAWLLGNNIATVSWPACGEQDVMEHINGTDPDNEGFDWVQGSVHGNGLGGGIQYHPAGFSARDWHTYGMIWTRGQVEYYVDDPANAYAVFARAGLAGTWPFDEGQANFIILNLAVGGDWPGSPNASTPFPSEYLVDYVRVYTN